MKKTVYMACTTLEPDSLDADFTSLSVAKAYAINVGHCTVYEYQVTPGVPGVEPDDAVLVANHCMHTGGEWEREEVDES